MAATFVKDPAIEAQPQAVGQFKLALRQMQADNSYPTGGYTLDPATVGVAKILFVPPAVSGGYVAQHNPATGKVQVFRQSAATSALTEVANAVDLSAVAVFELLIFGR